MQQQLSKKTDLKKGSVKNSTRHKANKTKAKFSSNCTSVLTLLAKLRGSLQKSAKNIPQNWISWLVEKQNTLNQKKPAKLQKLVHHLIRQGKKTRALKLVRHSFHFLAVDKKALQTTLSAQSRGSSRVGLVKANSLITSTMRGQKEISTKGASPKGASPKGLPRNKNGQKELLDFNQKASPQVLCPSPFPKLKESVTRHLITSKGALGDTRYKALERFAQKPISLAALRKLLIPNDLRPKPLSLAALRKLLMAKPKGSSKSSGRQQLSKALYPQVVTPFKSASPSSLSIFRLALQKVRPFFHLRKARKAGVNIQVPAILPPKNQDSLAIQWLIEGAKARKKKESRQPFAYHLAQEIRVAALRPKESYAFQKREEGAKQVQTHRNAARFRWW